MVHRRQSLLFKQKEMIDSMRLFIAESLGSYLGGRLKKKKKGIGVICTHLWKDQMCIELLKPNVSALILLTTVYHQITGVFSRATFICPKVPSHCYTLKRMFWQKCSCKPHGNWVLNPHIFTVIQHQRQISWNLKAPSGCERTLNTSIKYKW